MFVLTKLNVATPLASVTAESEPVKLATPAPPLATDRFTVAPATATSEESVTV